MLRRLRKWREYPPLDVTEVDLLGNRHTPRRLRPLDALVLQGSDGKPAVRISYLRDGALDVELLAPFIVLDRDVLEWAKRQP